MLDCKNIIKYVNRNLQLRVKAIEKNIQREIQGPVHYILKHAKGNSGTGPLYPLNIQREIQGTVYYILYIYPYFMSAINSQ
jgi:hypothetical protein